MALQDEFITELKGKKVQVFLVNGIKLTGTLVSTDAFTVVVHGFDNKQLIYKHAISTMSAMPDPAKLPRFVEKSGNVR